MRTWIIVVAFALVAFPAAPALADGPVVETTVGIDGSVPEGRAFDVAVTASSDRLWEGSVVVEAGSLRVGTPLELPAGTSKEVVLRMPPLPAGSNLRVFLESDTGTRTQAQRFGTSAGGAGVRVAALGLAPSLVDTLAATRTAPSGAAPTVVGVGVDDLDELGSYDYLVVGGPIPPGHVEDVRDWVALGGRLVGPPSAVGDIGVGGTGEIGGLPVTVVGFGEVIALAAGADPKWGLVLRDTGTPESGALRGGEFSDPYAALGAAATGVAGGPLGAMPGLLPGLVLYVALAGPINLFVLGRMRRREWAWVTVPVLAVVAVGALWVLGPRQQSVDLSVATVAVGGPEPSTHTAVSAIAAGDGTYHLGLEGDLVGGLGVRRADVGVGGDGTTVLTLSTGQPTGVYSWSPGSEAISATAVGAGWEVRNQTGQVLDAWGVIVDGRIHWSMVPLAPGEAATTEIVEAAFADPWTPPLMSVVWNSQLGGDQRAWTVYQPLIIAADTLGGHGGTEGRFVWGISDDHSVLVTVDGRDRAVEGVAMVVSPIEGAAPPTRASASLVSSEGVFRDSGSGAFYGDGSVVLAFRVDPASERLRLRDEGWSMTLGDGFSFFDLATGDFAAPVGTGTHDAGPFVGPSGDVFVRVQVRGGELWPAAISIEGLAP